MARNFVLAASLAIICLLAFLTISVAVREGIDVLVVLSVIILALFGLRHPRRAVVRASG